MKELDPMVFVAVFQEMLGWWLWAILALAMFGLTLFAWAVLRDRGIASRELVRAQLVGVAGGFAALFFMWWITSSSLGDVGGPIDVVLVLAIWTTGFLGLAILSYGLMRMRSAPPVAAPRESMAWPAGSSAPTAG